MFHLAAFSESQNTATLVPIAAVPDSQLAVSGDDIAIPSGLANIGFAYAHGTDMSLARLRSPQLRLIADIDLGPFGIVAEPEASPFLHNWMRNPIPLLPGEVLNFEAAGDGGGADIYRCLVGLTDGPQTPIDPANVRSVRFTAGQTAVAESWVNGAITFGQSLRGGQYQIVGCRVRSATMIAFRLGLVGQSWRPGGIGFDLDSDIGPDGFRYGGVGLWGAFDVNQPPTLDVLCVTTDSAFVGYMDLIRVGGVG